jgi:phosphatidate cytidylyltransferase
VIVKKIIERLLVFLIGIPLIVLLVLFLPWRHHLALNIVVVAFTGLGALEFSAMLKTKGPGLSRMEAFVLGILAPLSETLAVSCGADRIIVPVMCIAGAAWILLSRMFSAAAALDLFLNRLAAGFAVLIYPGAFMYWLIKMSGRENAGPVMLVFLLTAIGNDSSAWAAGMLFGKGNRGIVPASPNKSIAGFIGGAAGSVIVSAGAALIVPGFFVPRFASVPGVPPALLPAVVLGLLAGLAAMAGDLCESAVKRSAGFKDSGNIMLGRGGALDSIDSIAVAAPVFYLVFNLFFE